MRKIWILFDNWNCEPIGAYAHEDAALVAKQDYYDQMLTEDERFLEENILIESYNFYE